MTNTRITVEAIEALEKLGCADGINEIGELLRSNDGLAKHGEQGWQALRTTQLSVKLTRHLPNLPALLLQRDPDSKRLSIYHVAVRAIMLAQRAARWRQAGG